MSASIQKAAENALAAFLSSKLSGVTVIAGWPSHDKDLPQKALTVTAAGSRRDIPIERKILKQTNNGDTDVDAVWQIAACTQPFQLDIWTHSDFARDAIMADLDIYLNYGERGLGAGNYDIGNGVLLNLQDGWNAYDSKVDFFFDDPDCLDSMDGNSLKSYRATYRGDAHFMLAVPSTSPRQLLINFTQFLDGELDSDAITLGTDY